MAVSKPKKNNRVQLRVFVIGQDTFLERQIFETRGAALLYLSTASGNHGGLILSRPKEGGVEQGDSTYALLIPWHLIREVDIIGYQEDQE